MDRELRLQLAAKPFQNYALGGTRADVWDTLAAGYAVGKWNEVGSFNTAGGLELRDRFSNPEPSMLSARVVIFGKAIWKAITGR